MSKTAKVDLQSKKLWWGPPILRAIPSSLLLSLVIAGISVMILIQGQLSPDVIPFGDGRTFAQRAIELHGLLWSGQFRGFFQDILTKGMIPYLPTGLVFWMLPSSLATGAVYGLVNCMLWSLLMAIGIWGVLKELGAERLAPAVTVLSLANNYALDPSYYYYMDFPFAASCLVVVWLRLRALLAPSRGHLLVAGVCAALLLFVKAGSAFPFLILDSFSFLFFSMWHVAVGSPKRIVARGQSVLRQLGVWCMGFVPVALVALEGTGARRIVQQLLQNQGGSFWGVPMSETGILRALYFPLCLTFYYSLAIVTVILVLLVLIRATGYAFPSLLISEGETSRNQRRGLITILVTYLLIWGCVFSFLMSSRLIRSLPLMLPLVWIGILIVPWLRRVRPVFIVVCALLYAGVAYSQYHWGWLQKRNRWAEEYRLDGDWWNRLPAKRQDMTGGVRTTKHILEQVMAVGAASGKVAVGTQMLYWDGASLNWLAQQPYQRRGKPPPLEFVTAVTHRLAADRGVLEGANAFVLLVHPGIAEGRAVWECNVRAAKFFLESAEGKNLVRSVRSVNLGDGKTAALVIGLKSGLTGDALTAFVASTYGGREVSSVLRGGGFYRERHGIVDSVRYLVNMWGSE